LRMLIAVLPNSQDSLEVDHGQEED
jgi:hypothetical protein